MIGFLWETFKIKCLGGLREEVAREVRRHLRTNPAIRNVPQPFGYRMLKRFYGKGGLLSFLLRYAGLYAIIMLGCAAIVSLFPNWVPKSGLNSDRLPDVQNVTSYFLAAQAVMIGLLFPVALGVISLITQREDASSTVSDLQVYYSESFAFGVGASGIALSIALAIHVFWPAGYVLEYLGFSDAGTYFEVVLLIAHLLWLLVNFAALWYFLVTSLSFMRPAQRALMRRRYAALTAIPDYLTAHLLNHRYIVRLAAEIAKKVGWDKTKTALLFGGRLERGEVELNNKALSGQVLSNVWQKPLMWVIRRWLKRCNKVEGAVGSQPDLDFCPDFRRPLSDDGIICRRIGGIPLDKIERFVVGQSFRFKAKKP